MLEGVYDRPIDLNDDENKEYLRDVRVGDKVWVTLISLGRKGARLDKYIKPTAVEVTAINLEDEYRPITVDTSGTKLRYHSATSYDASLTRAKDECEHFHDLRVIEVANQIGHKDFQKKQNMFKKLIRTQAPVDEALHSALDWKDTLSEEEKGHIKKLIEMEKRV